MEIAMSVMIKADKLIASLDDIGSSKMS